MGGFIYRKANQDGDLKDNIEIRNSESLRFLAKVLLPLRG